MKKTNLKRLDNLLDFTANEEINQIISSLGEDKTEQAQENEQAVENCIQLSKTLKLVLICQTEIIDSRKTIANNTEKVLAKIVKDNKEIPVYLEGQNFQCYANLKQFLCQYVLDTFNPIKADTFNKLKTQLLENIPVKQEYACAGIQDGKFIAQDSYYDLKQKKLIKTPKFAPEKDFNCIENSNIDISSSCKPCLQGAESSNSYMVKDFYTNLIQAVGNSEALLCFAAALATPLYNSQKEIQAIPSVIFSGESHAGKTALLRSIHSIYGLKDNDIMSGSSTTFAIYQALNSRMSIPVAIEELNEKFFENSNSETLIKNTYNRTARERGTKSGVEKINIYTNFVATSNYSFKNPPEEVLSRILYANMKKSEFKPEKFKYFEEESRKDFPLILVQLLSYYDQAVPIYKEVYNKIKTLIENPSGNRYLMNVALACSVWEIINRICGSEIVYWQDLAESYIQNYESRIENMPNDSHVMMNYIAKLIYYKSLTYNRDFKLSSKGLLRLNPSRFVEAYNLVFAKEKENFMTKNTFIEIMLSDSRVKDTRDNPYNNVGRCLTIDLSNDKYLLNLIDYKRKCEG